jgi:molybdate transport system substrate-binding protein
VSARPAHVPIRIHATARRRRTLRCPDFARISPALLPLLTLLCAVLPSAARAAEASVAVAANFTEAAKEIARRFEAATGHRAVLSFGSTGEIYTQITQEAPYELFLSADAERPKKAVDEGFAVADSRFTYALGRIVLFSRNADLVKGEQTLRAGAFAKLAIANPVTAPYGAAATEALQKLGVYDALRSKLVMGNDITQTYQFVETGNAELGFVALSQVAGRTDGSRWIIPTALYTPIRQDAVLLRKGEGNEAARAFLAYLKSSDARAGLARFGYAAE